MRRTPPLTKGIAATLAVVLFASNVLLVHASETNLWSERQKTLVASLPTRLPSQPAPFLKHLPEIAAPSSVISKRLSGHIPRGFESNITPLVRSLTSSYGTVRKIQTPKTQASNSQTIIHIQDIHLNEEAQTNISKTIQQLINEKKVGLVALEGEFEPVDFSVFRKFPYQDSIRVMADYLLAEKKISGPIYTGYTSPVEIPAFVGVDDKVHYDANVEAYKQAAPLVKKYKAELAKSQRALAEEKARVFSQQLREFDGRVAAYRGGTLDWGSYVKYLAGRSASTSTDVEVLLAALELESKINFNAVETQRTQLISELVEKMDKAQSQELVDHSAAYRVGSLTHADFYDYLKQLCRKSGVHLQQYPAMDSYIRYVILSDGINVEKILNDVTAMETADYKALAQTPAEKQLVQKSKELYLTGKLLDFALTREEWNEYRGRHSGESRNPGWAPAFAGVTNTFEEFYRQAEFRDEAIAKNLRDVLSSEKLEIRSNYSLLNTQNAVVLVTGGFHSSGIDQRLLDAGYTVITFTPKISKIDESSGTTYLSVFTQEKTPLDKLFAGEKLFVVPRINPPGGATKPLAAGIGSEMHPEADPKDILQMAAIPDATLKRTDAGTEVTNNGATVVVKWTQGKLFVRAKATLKAVVIGAVMTTGTVLGAMAIQTLMAQASPIVTLFVLTAAGFIVMWILMIRNDAENDSGNGRRGALGGIAAVFAVMNLWIRPAQAQNKKTAPKAQPNKKAAPAKDSKTLQFLEGNVTEDGMALSYRATKEEWEAVGSNPDDPQDTLERLLVTNGLNLYDGALWQIIMGRNGKQKQVDNHTKRLSIGSSGGLDIKADRPGFRYGDKKLTAAEINPNGDGFFIRMIANRADDFPDIMTGRTETPNFPEGEPKHRWLDYKPIMGENAWVAIGELQSLFAAAKGKPISATAAELTIAMELLPYFEAMQAEMVFRDGSRGKGGVYHAPEGTAGKNLRGLEISNENNVSLLAAMRQLKEIVGKLPKTPRDRKQIADSLERIDNLIAGIEKYLKDFGFDETTGVFRQGMVNINGEFIPVNDFAVDCQTWMVTVLGVETIDKWKGKGAAFKMWEETKRRGGYYKDDILRGVGFTDHKDNDIHSGEWTAGAILAVMKMADEYQKANKTKDPAVTEMVQNLREDGALMREGLEDLKIELPDGTEAYKYANKRYDIPFGWMANPFASVASTAWIEFIDGNASDDKTMFNPFVLGGKTGIKASDLKTYLPKNPRKRVKKGEQKAEEVEDGEWMVVSRNFQEAPSGTSLAAYAVGPFNVVDALKIRFVFKNPKENPVVGTKIRPRLLPPNAAPGDPSKRFGIAEEPLILKKSPTNPAEAYVDVPITAFTQPKEKHHVVTLDELMKIEQIVVASGENDWLGVLGAGNKKVTPVRVEKMVKSKKTSGIQWRSATDVAKRRAAVAGFSGPRGIADITLLIGLAAPVMALLAVRVETAQVIAVLAVIAGAVMVFMGPSLWRKFWATLLAVKVWWAVRTVDRLEDSYENNPNNTTAERIRKQLEYIGGIFYAMSEGQRSKYQQLIEKRGFATTVAPRKKKSTASKIILGLFIVAIVLVVASSVMADDALPKKPTWRLRPPWHERREGQVFIAMAAFSIIALTILGLKRLFWPTPVPVVERVRPPVKRRKIVEEDLVAKGLASAVRNTNLLLNLGEIDRNTTANMEVAHYWQYAQFFIGGVNSAIENANKLQNGFEGRVLTAEMQDELRQIVAAIPRSWEAPGADPIRTDRIDPVQAQVWIDELRQVFDEVVYPGIHRVNGLYAGKDLSELGLDRERLPGTSRYKYGPDGKVLPFHALTTVAWIPGKDDRLHAELVQLQSELVQALEENGLGHLFAANPASQMQLTVHDLRTSQELRMDRDPQLPIPGELDNGENPRKLVDDGVVAAFEKLEQRHARKFRFRLVGLELVNGRLAVHAEYYSPEDRQAGTDFQKTMEKETGIPSQPLGDRARIGLMSQYRGFSKTDGGREKAAFKAVLERFKNRDLGIFTVDEVQYRAMSSMEDFGEPIKVQPLYEWRTPLSQTAAEKYSPNGKVLPFHAATTGSWMMDKDDAMRAKLVQTQRDLRKRLDAAGIGTLFMGYPEFSFHLTTFDLLTAFSAGLDKTKPLPESLEEPLRDQVFRAFKRLERENVPSFRFRLMGLRAIKGHGIGVRAEFLSKADEEAAMRFRQIMQEETGILLPMSFEDTARIGLMAQIQGFKLNDGGEEEAKYDAVIREFENIDLGVYTVDEIEYRLMASMANFGLYAEMSQKLAPVVEVPETVGDSKTPVSLSKIQATIERLNIEVTELQARLKENSEDAEAQQKLADVRAAISAAIAPLNQEIADLRARFAKNPDDGAVRERLSEIDKWMRARNHNVYSTTFATEFQKTRGEKISDADQQALEVLAGKLKNRGASRILDVGAGTGNWTAALKQLVPGSRVEAVETASSFVSILQKRVELQEIDAVHAVDMTNLADVDGEFDAITFQASLLHLLSGPAVGADAALRTGFDRLAPGGMAYAAVMVGSGKNELLIDGKNRIFQFHNEESLRAMFERAGFINIEMKREERFSLSKEWLLVTAEKPATPPAGGSWKSYESDPDYFRNRAQWETPISFAASLLIAAGHLIYVLNFGDSDPRHAALWLFLAPVVFLLPHLIGNRRAFFSNEVWVLAGGKLLVSALIVGLVYGGIGNWHSGLALLLGVGFLTLWHSEIQKGLAESMRFPEWQASREAVRAAEQHRQIIHRAVGEAIIFADLMAGPAMAARERSSVGIVATSIRMFQDKIDDFYYFLPEYSRIEIRLLLQSIKDEWIQRSTWEGNDAAAKLQEVRATFSTISASLSAFQSEYSPALESAGATDLVGEPTVAFSNRRGIIDSYIFLTAAAAVVTGTLIIAAVMMATKYFGWTGFSLSSIASLVGLYFGAKALIGWINKTHDNFPRKNLSSGSRTSGMQRTVRLVNGDQNNLGRPAQTLQPSKGAWPQLPWLRIFLFTAITLGGAAIAFAQQGNISLRDELARNNKGNKSAGDMSSGSWLSYATNPDYFRNYAPRETYLSLIPTALGAVSHLVVLFSTGGEINLVPVSLWLAAYPAVFYAPHRFLNPAALHGSRFWVLTSWKVLISAAGIAGVYFGHPFIAVAVVAGGVTWLTRLHTKMQLEATQEEFNAAVKREYEPVKSGHSTVQQVVDNIRARTPQLSRDLANAVRVRIESPAKAKLNETFPIAAALAVLKFFGQIFDSLAAALRAVFKVNADVVYLTFVNGEEDLEKIPAAVKEVERRNRRYKNRDTVIGIIVPEGNPSDLKNRALQLVQDTRRNAHLVASVIEEPQMLNPTFIGLFKALREDISQPQDFNARRVLEELELDITRDKRVVVEGTPLKSYEASERLLSIMFSILPRAGKYLMINMLGVLEAATKA